MGFLTLESDNLGEYEPCPRLYHATLSSKLPSIKRLGLRVSKKTKKATAYCKRYINHEFDDILGHGKRRNAPIEFDCIRDEAYRNSEAILEKWYAKRNSQICRLGRMRYFSLPRPIREDFMANLMSTVTKKMSMEIRYAILALVKMFY